MQKKMRSSGTILFMNVDPLLASMLFLWIGLLCLLGQACVRAFKKQKKYEGIILLAAIILIVLCSGTYALYIAWSLGCSFGLPLACME